MLNHERVMNRANTAHYRILTRAWKFMDHCVEHERNVAVNLLQVLVSDLSADYKSPTRINSNTA